MMQQQPSLSCPDCGSNQIWKDGLRQVKSETGSIDLQRYRCRACGLRFSESSARAQPGPNPGGARGPSNVEMLGSCSDACPPPITSDFKARGRRLNSHVGGRQPVSDVEVMAMQEMKIKRAAGATTLSKEELAGKIIEYAWFMKMNEYKPAAIESYTHRIDQLIKKGANLMDPRHVRRTIASVETWCAGTKKIMCDAYDVFVRMAGLSWRKPKYRYTPKLPFVPTTEEIDIVIGGSSRKLRIFLEGLRQTGADPGEMYAVEWADVDFKRRKVVINHPVKHHDSRIIDVSAKWLHMLEMLPRNSERIWTIDYKSLGSNLRHRRKRLAHEYGNPRLGQIKFTSLRHWKGTMEYHKDHDIMRVKELLGHRSLLNTQIYVHLEAKLFDQLEHEFIVRRARSIRGMLNLAAAGFEKFDQVGDVHLYRKPKTAET